ncbi:hypothetical protein [Methylibium petroleiphilum]|uniref:Uncharacterized protein n=1 Tax=Methylibium petroleiphilum (strain ATCC BAA-1232 / LMG 22953 / PM1) TaxID=420662 RepID=A2SPA4_METPP|nr:hypothetical protein [Methylibium petroleiphilum]ABM97393.1 hypothetical protein Mpe_B0629 [Methylibium petroleiphilum PM1]
MPAPTSSFVVDQLRGDVLADSMAKLHANPKKLPEGFHSVTVEPGVAMLVEPVNDHPYVFVLPNVVHRFESTPGSGTDRLRKRIEAGVFFRSLVDDAHVQAMRAASAGTRTPQPEEAPAVQQLAAVQAQAPQARPARPRP